MNRTKLQSALIALCLTAAAHAGDPGAPAKQNVPALTDDGWKFSLSLPGWIPWMTGETGLNGHIASVDLSPDDIVPRLDMVADVRAEATKGRLSIMGELLYMSLSDGVGTDRIVQKLDFQVDQTMADLGVGWRVLQGPRGWVDLKAGVRYTNLYQKVVLQPNDERIDELAGKLAKGASAARVARALRVLKGSNPGVPIAPLADVDRERIQRAVARARNNTSDRKEKIADVLDDALSRTIARTDDWWDPYIGVRGRLNLGERFYLTASGDIGGFGVGSDLTWQAEAALGMQVNEYLYSELGYRALGVDLDRDGLSVDTITHGAVVTLGVRF